MKQWEPTNNEQINCIHCKFQSADQSSWRPARIHTSSLLEFKVYFANEDHDFFKSAHLPYSFKLLLHLFHTQNKFYREDDPCSCLCDCTRRQRSRSLLWNLPLDVTQNQPVHLPVTCCYPDTAPRSIPSCFKVLIYSQNGFWKYFSKLVQVLRSSHGKPNHMRPPLQVLGGELLGYVRIPQPFS